MSRYQTPRTPRVPRYSGSMGTTSEENMAQLCEITAHRILRKGFIIEYLQAMTSIHLGRENNTGVVLIASAGSKSVHNVNHTDPGIEDGILDIATQGCGFSLHSLTVF
ncbi:hypothetical protein F4859DRAFT_256856 [Xylaria cf. heliscus]|nr:hypothetical protein F4859DRAFT_256856 [Xylaria cf. heliscus]